MPDPVSPAPIGAPASAPAAAAPAANLDAAQPSTHTVEGLAALLAQEGNPKAPVPAAQPAPAPDGEGKGEATPEPAADEETKPGDDTPEGAHPDDEEDDDEPAPAGKLPPEIQAKVDKRIGKINSKRRAAEARAQELEQKLAERESKLAEVEGKLTGKQQSAVAHTLGTHPAFLDPTPEAVDERFDALEDQVSQAARIAKNAKDLLDELDADERKSKETRVTLPNGQVASAYQVHEELKRQESLLLDLSDERRTLSKARKFVATRQQEQAAVLKDVPGLDPQALEGIFKEVPSLRSLPNANRLAAEILAGRGKLKGKAPVTPASGASMAKPAVQVRPPPAPSSPAAYPAANRPTVDTPKPGVNLKAFREGGATTNALAAALAG